MIDVVCGLISDGSGRLLACRRPAGKHLGGLWEFPGGNEALVRELREELGIETAVTGGLTPVVWDYGRGPIRLIPFFCRIVSGTTQPHEHDALEWVDAVTCDRLHWAAADGPILAEWRDAF
jgi:8-oxo-dGTP diphosphatase